VLRDMVRRLSCPIPGPKRVRFPSVPALVRIRLSHGFTDEHLDAEGNGHQLRLVLAAVSG